MSDKVDRLMDAINALIDSRVSEATRDSSEWSRGTFDEESELEEAIRDLLPKGSTD